MHLHLSRQYVASVSHLSVRCRNNPSHDTSSTLRFPTCRYQKNKFKNKVAHAPNEALIIYDISIVQSIIPCPTTIYYLRPRHSDTSISRVQHTHIPSFVDMRCGLRDRFVMPKRVRHIMREEITKESDCVNETAIE
jgi:hypothetical protein